MVVFSKFELLCFLGLIKCVFLGLVLVGFSIWCWVFLGGSDYNGGFLGGVLGFFFWISWLCCSIFNGFFGGLLMIVVVVVVVAMVLFWVFCFAMSYGCHSGGGGGGGGSGNVVVVIYCVRYIILLYYLYYFNVLNVSIKPLLWV